MITIFENIDTLSAALTEKLASLSKKGISSVAISGGKTPEMIFKMVALNHEEVIWENILLFWVDERCVPPDHDQSNYKMTKETLIDNIPIPSKNILRIHGENDPIHEAKRYTRQLRSILKYNKLPVFDLIILGMGGDGHTASIFPNRMDLLNSHEIYSTASHPATNQKRITLTGNVINNACEVIFIILGSSKSMVLEEIVTDSENAKKYPAYYINPKSGKLHWWLNSEAAKSAKVMIN